MSKLIVFDIFRGNFVDGFDVKVSVMSEQATQVEDSFLGKFPPNSDLPNQQQSWRSSYRRLPFIRRMVLADDDITEISVSDFNQVANEFSRQVQNWFEHTEFNSLAKFVLDHTAKGDSLRVSIRPQMQAANQTLAQQDVDLLLRLPWHLWSLFRQSRPNAEILLETRGTGRVRSVLRQPRILAIIGYAPELDTYQDRQLVNRLRWSGATIKWLEQPSVETLNDRLWEENWDIIFFAGHSSSSEQTRAGLIQLNANETVPLTLIQDGFRRAAAKNLMLAIINSCDSLNAAEDSIEAGVSYAVAARDLLIDQMAIKFLRFFLEELTSGKPLSVAMKEARSRLTGFENTYPCASWLPVLCQKPGAPDLVWKLPWWVVLRRKISKFTRQHKILTGATLATLTIAVILAVIAWFTPTPGICGFEATESYLSCGERSLISDESYKKESYEVPKDLLDKAFREMRKRNPDYDLVDQSFNDSWDLQKKTFENKEKETRKYYSDAQTLIYRNNSFIKADPAKAKATFVIAAVVPLEKSLGAAQEMLRGIAQAQDEAVRDQNRKNALNLQVLIVDEDGGGSGAKAVAEEIASHQQILAVVGTRKSESVESVLPVYEDNSLALISGTATDSGLRSKQGNRIFFRTVADTGKEAEVLREHLRNTVDTSPNVAVFRSGNYGEAMENDFSRSGITVTPHDFESFSETQLQGKQAIAVFPEAGENDPAAAQAMNIVIQNNGKLPIVGGTSTSGGRLISLLNESELKNPNFVIALPWFSNNPDCRTSLYPKYKFDAKFCDYWGGSPTWRSATSYDATQAVVNALRKLRDDNKTPTRELVLAQLEGGNSLSGVDEKPITFNNGERQDASMILVEVVPRSSLDEQQKRGKFEYVPYSPSP